MVEETGEYIPKTFALLTNDTIYSTFERKTKEGKLVNELKNETKGLPIRTVIIDRQGVRIPLRYIPDCPTFIISEQKKLGIEANTPDTMQAYYDNKIENGFIVSKSKTHLDYLETCGYIKKMKEGYTRPQDIAAWYEEFMPQAIVKQSNNFVKAQAKALNKFDELSTEDKKTILLKQNGSFYVISDDEEDWFEDVKNEVNGSDSENRSLIDLILNFEKGKKEQAVDISVLIGEAINLKLVSFKENDGNVVGRSSVDKDWNIICPVTASLPIETKLSLFTDFLKTKDGEAVLDNIKEAVKTKDGEAVLDKKTVKK